MEQLFSLFLLTGLLTLLVVLLPALGRPALLTSFVVLFADVEELFGNCLKLILVDVGEEFGDEEGQMATQLLDVKFSHIYT